MPPENLVHCGYFKDNSFSNDESRQRFVLSVRLIKSDVFIYSYWKKVNIRHPSQKNLNDLSNFSLSAMTCIGDNIKVTSNLHKE